MQIGELSLNRPQLRNFLVRAPEERNMWGRGTGKSNYYGIRSHACFYAMPKGVGALTGRTFGQLQTVVVPEMIYAWAQMGYYRGIHYEIGKRPPKSIPFEDPLRPPLKLEHFIWWNNGSGIQMISQDREGSGRGYNFAWAMADEGLTLIADRYRKEVANTVRGHDQVGWKDTRLLHSKSIASSKPTGSEGDWLLEGMKYYEEDGHDYERLLDLMHEIELGFVQGLVEGADDKDLKHLWDKREALRLKIRFYECRKGDMRGLYYNEANAFDNLENLGLDYLVRTYRDLTGLEFLVEIINKTLKEVEGGFYAAFNEKIHCYYDTYNYSYLDNLEWDHAKLTEVDCRRDGDLDPTKPLDLSGDYGYYLNCLVVGQELREAGIWVHKYLNSFWLKPPKDISDVAEEFCRYYKYHKTKVVNYYYDQTAIDHAGKKFSYAEQVMNVLHKHGWTVNKHHIGKVPGHNARYQLFNRAFKNDTRVPVPLYSMPRCRYLVLSMKLAGVTQGKHGFEKDKRPEKKWETVPQEEATHQTDAMDTQFYAKYISKLKEERDYLPNLMGRG